MLLGYADFAKDGQNVEIKREMDKYILASYENILIAKWACNRVVGPD